MAKKRKEMGLKQASMGLVGGAVILSTGSQVVSSVGGSGAGLTAAARFLPTMGTALGAGLTLQQVRKLQSLKSERNKNY